VRFLLAITGLFLAVIPVRGADREGLDFFEQKIRPVLVKHCYECHSAKSEEVKGGLLVDSAPVISISLGVFRSRAFCKTSTSQVLNFSSTSRDLIDFERLGNLFRNFACFTFRRCVEEQELP
jgi:hypothetical protein